MARTFHWARELGIAAAVFAGPFTAYQWTKATNHCAPCISTYATFSPIDEKQVRNPRLLVTLKNVGNAPMYTHTAGFYADRKRIRQFGEMFNDTDFVVDPDKPYEIVDYDYSPLPRFMTHDIATIRTKDTIVARGACDRMRDIMRRDHAYLHLTYSPFPRDTFMGWLFAESKTIYIVPLSQTPHEKRLDITNSET